jgi:hypothetical protein
MDESNGFTQYGLVPSGPLNLNTKLGKLSLSALGDLSKKILQGEAIYDSDYGSMGITKTIGQPANFNGSIFAPGGGQISSSGSMNGIDNINYLNDSFNAGTDTKGNYYGSYTQGPVTVGGNNNNNYYGTYQDGPYSARIDNKGNFSGSYEGDGFQINATDKSLDTSFQVPMVDESDDMMVGAQYDAYSKTPEVYGQFHRQLSDNGFVDASGRLTPKGYDLMIKGGFSF